MLLVAAYWRTNLTLRQLVPLFGVSKSAADRIVDHLGPALALQPRKRFRKGTVLIVDGTLVPTRDHQIAEQSKNYRYSTNHQAVRSEGSRRPYDGDRRRRLPGHRPGHPAPPPTRPAGTPGLERGTRAPRGAA